MARVRGFIARFRSRLRHRRGQTSFEYFLLIAGVAVLVGAAVVSFGGGVKKGINAGTTCLTGIQVSSTATGSSTAKC